MTELRKQQNRMNFGEIGEDVYQEDLGHNRGNIGKGGVGGGSLRMAQVRRSKIVIQGDKFTWDYTNPLQLLNYCNSFNLQQLLEKCCKMFKNSGYFGYCVTFAIPRHY